MKLKRCLVTLLLFFCFMFGVKANTYNVGEYVYYDPYNHKSCSINDYWTIYNQDSTCYRWVVIQTGIKEQSYDAVRLLLDHDIGVSDYSNRTKLYSDVKQKWNDSNILQINTLGNNMVLALYKNSYEKNDNWDKTNPTEVYYVKRAKTNAISFLHTNTVFYYKGIKYYNYNKTTSPTNNGGYWISHSDTDNDPFADPETISKDQLAYYINSNGYVFLSSVNAQRGVRPTIYIKLSALSNTSYSGEEIELEKVIANAKNSNLNITYNEAKHVHTSLSLNSNIYFYPQGFYFNSEDDFFVYMAHRARTENGVDYDDKNSSGILLQYANKKFNHIGNYDFSHGNDMSIINNNNLYIGSNKDAKIIKFDLQTSSRVDDDVIKDPWGTALYYGAFTYDTSGEYFYGIDGNRRIFVREVNKKYNSLYTFDAPLLETLQTMTYNNGYLYISTYEVPKDDTKCDTRYQLYCYGDDRLTTVYVYNVKFNSNGDPSKFFGKLEKKYITNNINEIGNKSKLYYEIEGIGAIDNNLLLGFARTDANYSPTVAYPVVYSYPLTHRTLTYTKGTQNKKDNIMDKTYTEISAPFTYSKNEEFLGWKNNDGIVSNSTLKIEKDMELSSIYTEFEKDSIIDKNILKTGLKNEIASFASKNFCHNCKFNLPSSKKYIGTGDKVGVYFDNKKLKEYEVLIKGDVNGNGEIDIFDYIKIMKDIMDMTKLNGVYKEAADVTQNGTVDIFDYIRVMKTIMEEK